MIAEWQNFYVITGSAGAGLTGLTFVVIALANRRRVTTIGLRAFVTPTIVHFGTVLALAAFLNVPRQSAVSLGVGLGAAGFAGLIYGGAIAVNMRRIAPGVYVPVGEDWLWHVTLPTVVYGALLVMAFLAQRRLEESLYGVAAVSMLLLFIGIHNAWDVAVSLSLIPSKDSRQDPEPGGTGPGK